MALQHAVDTSMTAWYHPVCMPAGIQIVRFNPMMIRRCCSCYNKCEWAIEGPITIPGPEGTTYDSAQTTE